MKINNYRVIFEPEKEGGYHAYCPALRGCHSYGDTLDEAKENITEAIEAYLESLAKHGEEIPIEEPENQFITTISINTPPSRFAIA
jgi:predicted RNase H-like HicB family nuclease